MHFPKTKILGYGLIVLSLLIFTVVWYKNSPRFSSPIVFSEKGMLEILWNNYKTEYLEKDTFRALDKQQDSITTSEGQSYTMLRAVWMDDKETFDAAYKWTKDNLSRKEDRLFSWLFGKQPSGKYGVLTDRGGYNSASDADSDIALSLVFAYGRWGEKYYLDDAKAIVKDIWEKEVIVINGVPYLTANNLEKFSSAKPIINVSYFSPYAYRIFAKIDPAHDWNGLVKSSYDVLEKTASSTLDKSQSAGLPPDWIVLNKTTGAVEATGISNLTTNYSYDALRTPWRIALDYQWFKEPRAKQYLDKLSFLSNEFREKNKIGSVYGHDGSVISDSEAPAMYAGSIGYFLVSDEDTAEDVFEQKIIFLYNSDTSKWKNPLSYYDENWVWFGIGLYNNLLPNLSTF